VIIIGFSLNAQRFELRPDVRIEKRFAAAKREPDKTGEDGP